MARRFHRTKLAAALLLALPAGAVLADPPDYGLCRANSLLQTYVPGLRTDVPRETAPTDFDAATVTVVKESSYLLEGDVVATRADQRLAADRVSYDQPTSHLQAEGDVRYQDKDVLFSASRADGKLDTDVTTLDDVHYQLLAARGNGVAKQATRTADTRTDLTGVTYSTCDPDQRDWEIAAKSIELDHVNGVGKARGMRVRFKDTTILALPYATFPIDDRRRSGFLYPQLGGSNDDGFDLLVPYYLNLAPNYDATLVPRIITERGFMLGGTAGQAVVWYTGQFYALFFLLQIVKIDAGTANLLIAGALAIGTPFFIFFGWLSDRIGRKPIVLAGCILAAASYFPIFKALTQYANPAMVQAAANKPVTVVANTKYCSFQFDPIGNAKFTSACDIAKAILAKRQSPIKPNTSMA